MDLYERVSFSDIDLSGDFWEKRQDINRETTIYSVMDRFDETGRFRAFEFVPLDEGGIEPHFFWDSDIAKWIESVAYIIEKYPDRKLEAKVDEVVDLIEKNQEENGYFNLYFTVVEPQNRFTKQWAHELYCAGHLIEAAVAYYNATGKSKLLDIMIRYVDCIEKAFVTEKTAKFETPGHEEIELALYKLYKTTGNRKFLELSLYFINKRGTVENEREMYNQSYLPVREQTTAEGHSVRACYLYSAMADFAAEMGDAELLHACETIFSNIYDKRAYITGGIGSSKYGEAFTVDYDLPNSKAYAETCAAIGLAFFAGRMQRFSPAPEYADIIERVLYNGMLSGVSLDGKSFFYVNPLEILRLERDRNKCVEEKETFGEVRRQSVFDCSCCPPNVTRFIATVGDYIYTHRDDAVFVHQYMSSISSFEANGRQIKISQKTNYPISGKIDIVFKNMKGMSAALRIPAWCGDYTVYVDGGKAEKKPNGGYLFIKAKSDIMSVTLELEMTPRFVFSRAEVAADAGLVAVCRGPLVYCMESCDNGDNLRSILLKYPIEAEEYYNSELDCIGLKLAAERVKSPEDSLYCDSPIFEPISAKFIPYYAFANREESDMLVWCRYTK